MILIPGLACSPEVWRGAERRFGDSWQLHLVTIAGFAGTEPIEPPLLDAVRRAVLRYIDDEHLESPVIMGHSLGAMVALWVAGTATSPIGAVIALDGVAYGAALGNPAATPAAMRPRAEAVRARVAAFDDEIQAVQARAMFAPMVTDPDDLEWIMRGVLASDAASVGQGMYELMTTDVRPFAAAIKAPVLMMVAGEHFDGELHPDLSPWEHQLDGVDQRRVVLVPNARHFVMVDAEQFVYDEVARFVAAE